ncbi:unnamed protein product, partial [marine sediment metagenome]
DGWDKLTIYEAKMWRARYLTTRSHSGMRCFYCTEKFMATKDIIKCKINGQVIPREVLLSKEPYENCPLKPQKRGK